MAKLNMKNVKAKGAATKETKEVVSLYLDKKQYATFKKLIGDGSLSRTVDALIAEYIAAHKGSGKK